MERIRERQERVDAMRNQACALSVFAGCAFAFGCFARGSFVACGDLLAAVF
jgi:hypothetical protein